MNYGNLLWGCAKTKYQNKIENLQTRCIRNVVLKKFKAHTDLEILNRTDKSTYCRYNIMHQFKHDKLPASFSGNFTDIINSEKLQIHHNDYNYINKPVIN